MIANQEVFKACPGSARRRTLKGRTATIELRLGRDLSEADRFGAFNEVEVVVRQV